jgi:hypothetical protein
MFLTPFSHKVLYWHFARYFMEVTPANSEGFLYSVSQLAICLIPVNGIFVTSVLQCIILSVWSCRMHSDVGCSLTPVHSIATDGDAISHSVTATFHLKPKITEQEICTLLGYYAASSGSSLPTFRFHLQRSRRPRRGFTFMPSDRTPSTTCMPERRTCRIPVACCSRWSALSRGWLWPGQRTWYYRAAALADTNA